MFKVGSFDMGDICFSPSICQIHWSGGCSVCIGKNVNIGFLELHQKKIGLYIFLSEVVIQGTHVKYLTMNLKKTHKIQYVKNTNL